jgi:hypothetical protein
MCATVNKYQATINELQNVIYPSILNILEEVVCYRNIYEYEGLEKCIVAIKEEFSSLCSLEDKLVFPAIISVFNSKKEDSFFPNIQEIIFLTSNKENKIKTLVSSIIDITKINKNQLQTDFEKEVYELIQLFNDTYFPSKHKWISLLQMLTPKSVACKNRSLSGCKCTEKSSENLIETMQYN